MFREWKQWFLFPLAGIFLFGVIGYFAVGRQMGVEFAGGFLRERVTESGYAYAGRVSVHDVVLTVDGNAKNGGATVTFDIEGQERQVFRVVITTPSALGQNVELYRGTELWFQGTMQEELPGILWDSEQELVTDFKVTFSNGAEGPLDRPYEVSRWEPIGLALRSGVDMRGHTEGLAMMLLLLGLAFAELRWPLALFRFRYMFDVQDPEPTEWYWTMHTFGCVLLVIFALIFAIIAMF